MRAVRAKRICKAIAKLVSASNVKSQKRHMVKAAWRTRSRNASQLRDKGACGRREGRKPHQADAYLYGFRLPNSIKKRLNGKSRKPISDSYRAVYRDVITKTDGWVPYEDNA